MGGGPCGGTYTLVLAPPSQDALDIVVGRAAVLLGEAIVLLGGMANGGSASGSRLLSSARSAGRFRLGARRPCVRQASAASGTRQPHAALLAQRRWASRLQRGSHAMPSPLRRRAKRRSRSAAMRSPSRARPRMPSRTSTRVSRASASCSSTAARASSNSGSQAKAMTLPQTTHASLHGDGQGAPSAARSSRGRPPGNAREHAAWSSSMHGLPRGTLQAVPAR